jgi:hypothetical protein
MAHSIAVHEGVIRPSLVAELETSRFSTSPTATGSSRPTRTKLACSGGGRSRCCSRSRSCHDRDCAARPAGGCASSVTHASSVAARWSRFPTSTKKRSRMPSSNLLMCATGAPRPSHGRFYRGVETVLSRPHPLRDDISSLQPKPGDSLSRSSRLPAYQTKPQAFSPRAHKSCEIEISPFRNGPTHDLPGVSGYGIAVAKRLDPMANKTRLGGARRPNTGR